ncbi:transcriptional regulator [Cupriavidus sp. AcVe19-6a]|uniref:transcriptional regulator n=1 Tax=Cupriavidus sp. AcVe19-6a TaxID=2821358 RepID=UPI001FD868AF|nr:transcriptional regulator [Cupriavidus sp. AcVe19-6a]
MNNAELNPIFTREQLDLYFGSYIGMEGGNPAGAVWFCDNAPSMAEPLVEPLLPQTVPNAWDSAYRHKKRHEMERWQSHKKIARIMAAARAQTIGTALRGRDWKDYFDHQLYARNGAEFKLSLYPLPARTINQTSWSRAFRGQPALIPKQRYMDLCRDGKRFAFIDDIRGLWKPKVVVCFGERYEDYFVKAFQLSTTRVVNDILQPADQIKPLRLFVRDDTRWIICPALAGAAGLMSDVLLDAMGQYIARWLEPEDFPPLSIGADVPTYERTVERGHRSLSGGRGAGAALLLCQEH